MATPQEMPGPTDETRRESKAQFKAAAEPSQIHAARPSRKVDPLQISPSVLLAHPLPENAEADVLLAAEQYRLLRSRVMQVRRAQKRKVFLVTSALSGDGKTLTSVNLALALGQLPGVRVLFAELDLRRPSAHALLGVKRDPDHQGFLDCEEHWRDCLWSVTPNVDALLAINPSLTPNESLHGDRLPRFLEEAQNDYDLIIIDTAPLLVAVDTHAILPHVNSVIYVLRADVTPIGCVNDALAILGDKVLGCVLNSVQKLKYESYYEGYVSR